jgi:translation initiation factor IF-2
MEKTEGQNLRNRPPVIVVLGHVDHGKTTLLDYIRKSNVAEKETGGITQHIGAYEIEFPSTGSGQAKRITFIDTPGHEAFSSMRQRGAKIADIALLVVDSVEGIKPQTKEAIEHIKKVGIPMVAVLNKIDKQGANVIKAKQQLAEAGVLVEGFGGDVPVAEISAKTGQGINDLLEIVVLIAEMKDLKADFATNATGVVIETFLDKNRGPTATILLNNGILKKGDIIATPSALAKVRFLENFQRKIIEQAVASMPAVVLGFDRVPRVGEAFKVFNDMESAVAYVEKKEKKKKDLSAEIYEGDKKILNIILKSDVLGSLEAIEGVLKALPQDLVLIRFLKSEVGDVNENDIKLAISGKAIIFGFRVGVDSLVEGMIDKEGVKFFKFEIIYELIQKVREMMQNLLKPEIKRSEIAFLEVLAVFKPMDKGQVIGCRVNQGFVKKDVKAEVLREEKIIDKGKILDLQRNNVPIDKAKQRDEIGILFAGEKRAKIKIGDSLTIFEEKTIEHKIS